MLKEYDVLSIWEDVLFLKRYVLLKRNNIVLNWYDFLLTCNDLWLREHYCLMNDMLLWCLVHLRRCFVAQRLCPVERNYVHFHYVHLVYSGIILRAAVRFKFRIRGSADPYRLYRRLHNVVTDRFIPHWNTQLKPV